MLTNNDGVTGPKKIILFDLLITTAGGIISGVFGSVLLMVIILLFGGVVDVSGGLNQGSYGMVDQTSSMLPLMLGFITFLVSLVVTGVMYFFMTLTDQRYKRTVIHYGQISFFTLLVYIFLAPIYIYAGLKSYANIMIVFLIHNLILAFGVMILLEIMNNYRYVLIGFYGSFVGLFLTGIISYFLFGVFGDGYAKLMSLLIILPLINGLIIFFKGIFEWIYFKYYSYFGMDQLGDIFRQIEIEENEIERKSLNKDL